MTCCLVLSVDLATDFSATFGPSVFGRSAIVIREFASASIWLFMVCMPCRVVQSTSTNLLCYVRPGFVLLTDSDVRHGNISTDEEHWVDHHKMIGSLAPFFRSFVISSSSVVCDADVDEHMVVAVVCLHRHRRQHGWTCTQPRFAELRWEIVSCESTVAWSSGE